MSRFSLPKKSSTLFLATCLLLSGCSIVAFDDNYETKLSNLNAQLESIVSQNSCTASFQCKVLDVGARACGGPSKYVIYSTMHTSQEKAEQLALQIAQQEHIKNTALKATHCFNITEIQSLCIDQQCQLFNIR